MIRSEFVEFILCNIGQSAEELKDNLDTLAAAEKGETLFPQSDEEIDLHNELGDLYTDILPTLEKIREVCDFYECLRGTFGTYNPA